MKVRELMTAKPFYCLPQTKLGAVAELMRDCDCGAIPVVTDDDARTPVGMITDRDIVTRVLARGLDAREVVVRDHMTAPPSTIGDDCDLDGCVGLLARSRLRRAIGVDPKGHLIGIVAQADLAGSGTPRESGELLREVSRV